MQVKYISVLYVKIIGIWLRHVEEDPKGDHKHYVRSDTLYPYLPVGKKAT